MYSDDETRSNRHLLAVVKVATFILCLAGFIANSYMIFIQFIGKKTITSQNVENYNGLSLPSITMCSLSGFKEEMDEYKDLKLDNYLNKTLELGEVFSGYYYYDEDDRYQYIDSETIKVNSTLWKLTTTYSQYKGRCYTLTAQKLVSYFERSSLLLD